MKVNVKRMWRRIQGKYRRKEKGSSEVLKGKEVRNRFWG